MSPGRGRRLLQTWALPLLLVVLWEVATRTQLLDPRFFVPLTEIAATVVDLLVEGRLAGDLATTLRRLVVAFAIAAVGGVTVGIVTGSSRVAALLFRPVTDTLYPTPKIALLPLLIIIVGLGETAFTLTAFATAFFQISLSTRASVVGVDPTLVEAARTFGANGRRYVTRLLLPAIAPGLLNGLRIGMATCLITLVVVEFVAADAGLGSLIRLAGQQFAVEQIYAGLALTGVLGHLVNAVFRTIERVALPWQDTSSDAIVATGG